MTSTLTDKELLDIYNTPFYPVNTLMQLRRVADAAATRHKHDTQCAGAILPQIEALWTDVGRRATEMLELRGLITDLLRYYDRESDSRRI